MKINNSYITFDNHNSKLKNLHSARSKYHVKFLFAYAWFCLHMSKVCGNPKGTILPEAYHFTFVQKLV